MLRTWVIGQEGHAMARWNESKKCVVGDAGELGVREDDEVTLKLIMLIEGECEGLGPTKAAHKFGYTKQRYFQLRSLFQQQGSGGLYSKRRGPKSNYRRTNELVRQIIRHRFLDPNASPEVIAQKLKQAGNVISVRTVERVIADFGLQKKTLQVGSSRKRRGS